MQIEYVDPELPKVQNKRTGEVKDQRMLVTDQLYNSWADCNYSPSGYLLYTFSYEDTFPVLSQHLPKPDFEYTIESDLVGNRLQNWKVTMRPFDKYPEPEQDINDMLLYGSLIRFNYNIWNLIPFDISEEKVAEYKATKDFEDTGEDHKQIDKLLLALRYNLVLNYSLTSNLAETICTYPERWESLEAQEKKIEDDEYAKAYSRFTSQLSRIPNDLYVSRGRGKKGGTLTDKATNLLYEYLVKTEQKVSNADLEQFMLYTSTTIGSDKNDPQKKRPKTTVGKKK